MITDKEFEDLQLVIKTFETEKYTTTTEMLVDEEGKVYYKWAYTTPKEADIADYLLHNKLFRKLY